jgi:NitT/TauT family transport system substrate-binding protein
VRCREAPSARATAQLGYTAEYIADMDGFFKKEGLTVKANTARGSAPAIQDILSGTALLSWVGWLESVIDIANKDAPLQSVAFTGRRSTLAIVSDTSKKPLAKPQNLVGNRIGIPSEGGTSETTLDLLLASNGIDQDKVPRQVTGFTPGTFELIKKAGSRASSSAPRRRSSSARPSRTPCSSTPPTTAPTA